MAAVLGIVAVGIDPNVVAIATAAAAAASGAAGRAGLLAIRALVAVWALLAWAGRGAIVIIVII